MVVHFLGRCPIRIRFFFVSLAAALLGIFLLFQSTAASADKTPYAAELDWGGKVPPLQPNGYSYGYASPAAACKAYSDLFWSDTGAYTHFTLDPVYRYITGDCFYVVNGTTVQGTRWWDRHGSCPRGGYVMRDGNGPAPKCECPPKQDLDPVKRCVPQPPEACSIAPLPLYYPDPYPLDIANLTPRMQSALGCLQGAISGAQGTSSVGSGFRPEAYNDHLRRVWDKFIEIQENKEPACELLRLAVTADFNSHKLKYRPAKDSPHLRGEAFDLTSSLAFSTLDALASGCQVNRNLKVKDPVHFIHE